MKGLPFPSRVRDGIRSALKCFKARANSEVETLNNGSSEASREHLFNRAQADNLRARSAAADLSAGSRSETCSTISGRENPYFALWVVYKRIDTDHSIAEGWDEYLLQRTREPRARGDRIYARNGRAGQSSVTSSTTEIGRFPSLSFERIWFLHYLRGPERMLQTRAVLGMLTAELAACTSA